MSMLVGDVNRIAVEAQPEERSNGWIFGRFRFWIGGEAVGNWEEPVDLKGCVRWLRDFETTPRDRFDSRLEGLDAHAVFRLLYDTVYGPTAIANPEEQPIPNAFARFHISHLGMSAFERFDILLLDDQNGQQRCLWRRAESSVIKEVVLERGEIARVARVFADSFEDAYLKEAGASSG